MKESNQKLLTGLEKLFKVYQQLLIENNSNIRFYERRLEEEKRLYQNNLKDFHTTDKQLKELKKQLKSQEDQQND